MNKRDKRKVMRALIKARELMNNRGRHWTKRNLKQHEKGEPVFCALGGLNEVTTGRQGYSYLGPRYEDPILDEAKLVLAETISGRRPRSVVTAETIIFQFNDHVNTKWGDVSRKFRTAARRIEKELAA